MVPETFTYSPEVLARFWAKVQRKSADECWEWTAGTNKPHHYGVFHPRKPLTVGAHRFSLELKIGRAIKPGLYSCHTCDNPPCVNPAHLYEGTHQQNVDDAVRRKRHKHGEHGPSKLSDAQVLAIRTRAASGEKNRSLAAEYGVNESLISMINRGLRWTHLGGPLSSKYNKRKAA